MGDAQTGVAVTASGQHNLKSVALTAGLAGSDTVAVGAAGTVTVNNIGGTTRAAVTGTDINAELDNSMAGDVAVKAHDVTKSESHVAPCPWASAPMAGPGSARLRIPCS